MHSRPLDHQGQGESEISPVKMDADSRGACMLTALCYQHRPWLAEHRSSLRPESAASIHTAACSASWWQLPMMTADPAAPGVPSTR